MDNLRFLVRRPASLLAPRALRLKPRPALRLALRSKGRMMAGLAAALVVALPPLSSLPTLAQNTSRPKAARPAAPATAPATVPATVPARGTSPTPMRSAATSAGGVVTATVAPRTDGLNVLIVAFDDLSTPLASPAAEAAPDGPEALQAPENASAMPALPTAPVPAAPPVLLEVPAIQPAASSVGRVEFRALAQKKPREKTKGEKFREQFSDEAFRAVPEPLPPMRPQDGALAPTAPNSAADAPRARSAAEGAFAAPAPATPFTVDSAQSGAGAAAMLGPGRAQAVAQPLRRALVRAGFGDVLAVAPGSVTLARVMEANRLSPRVLEAARAGLADLALLPESGAPATSASTTDAPTAQVAGTAVAGTAVAGAPDADRWASLYQAASRIGQAVGYRSVVVVGVAPRVAGAPAGGAATYALAVVDALRETGEPIVFDEEGATISQANESAALSAAALVTRSLSALPPVGNSEKSERASKYMARARQAHASGDFASAQEFLSQVLAFEPARVDARLLMADLLSRTDADAAARAYRTLGTLEGLDGAAWTKVAVAFTVGADPQWPRALEAGRKALGLGYDTSELRHAMATAQLGRASLFREAGRQEKAEEAEADARIHLDRALALAPEDPAATRLMVRVFSEQGRFREALRLLDGLALQYPDDVELQTMYASSLFGAGGRDEDAFVAWARVWRLSGQAAVPVEAARYRRLSEGFDQRLASLGKRAAQLSSSVSAGTAPRETALLQMTRYKEDMDAAIGAIRVMQPAYDARMGLAHQSRVLSADLMSQAMATYATYLETGQELLRERANGLQRQAIIMLNAARTTRG